MAASERFDYRWLRKWFFSAEPVPTEVIAEMQPEPRGLYARRLETRQETTRRLDRRERWIANGRLVVFLAGAAAAWIAFVPNSISPLWLLPPAALYGVLVVAHDRVIRSRRKAERGVLFYSRGIARLDDRWIGSGKDGTRFLDADHPYAEDLDLFGNGSLFELLCTAETRPGEERLAEWLLHPAQPEEVRARQGSVEELRPLCDLREEIAVLDSDLRTGLDPDQLIGWCAKPSVHAWGTALVAGRILTIVATASLAGWIFFGTGPLPLAGAFALQLILAQSQSRRAGIVLRDVERPGKALSHLARVLGRLEKEAFESSLLRQLQAELRTEGTPPSRRIDRLARLVEMHEWARNAFFAPFAILLNWRTEIAFAIDRWRATFGPAVPCWLNALGEIEALGSLACYAFEHPDDPFPEIVEEGPLFDATGIGHPLIPAERCIGNDLRLDRRLQVFVVSGSNMSGKSTLLRTVGTNLVLALAGAPVRAQRLRVSLLAAGASIRARESLLDGISRFYGEIKRIRRLVEITEGPLPLLFLIDEIFHGTNSHDRRIGAEAVVRGLVDRGAIGLVTTHDLALARIVEELAPRAANVHFEDHLEGDRIVFDYRIRPGVVEKSNALALMRSIGLDV